MDLLLIKIWLIFKFLFRHDNCFSIHQEFKTKKNLNNKINTNTINQKIKGEIMKSQNLFSTLCVVILFIFASNSFAQTTTVVTTPKKTYVVTKEAFPQWP